MTVVRVVMLVIIVIANIMVYTNAQEGRLTSWDEKNHRISETAYVRSGEEKTMTMTSDEPYSAYENIIVEYGGTLIIEENTRILFASNKGIQVSGTLKAIGHQHRKISFEAMNSSAAWSNIEFFDSNADSRIEHVTISDGGINVLKVTGGGVTLKHIHINNCKGGIHATMDNMNFEASDIYIERTHGTGFSISNEEREDNWSGGLDVNPIFTEPIESGPLINLTNVIIRDGSADGLVIDGASNELCIITSSHFNSNKGRNVVIKSLGELHMNLLHISDGGEQGGLLVSNKFNYLMKIIMKEVRVTGNVASFRNCLSYLLIEGCVFSNAELRLEGRRLDRERLPLYTLVIRGNIFQDGSSKVALRLISSLMSPIVISGNLFEGFTNEDTEAKGLIHINSENTPEEHVYIHGNTIRRISGYSMIFVELNSFVSVIGNIFRAHTNDKVLSLFGRSAYVRYNAFIDISSDALLEASQDCRMVLSQNFFSGSVLNFLAGFYSDFSRNHFDLLPVLSEMPKLSEEPSSLSQPLQPDNIIVSSFTGWHLSLDKKQVWCGRLERGAITTLQPPEDSEPIVVRGVIYIPNTATLIIEACVILHFVTGAGIVVEGTLIARGKPNQHITMTTDDANNFWNGIHFSKPVMPGSVQLENDDLIYLHGNILEFVNLDTCGTVDMACVSFKGYAPFIRHVSVINSRSIGLEGRNLFGMSTLYLWDITVDKAHDGIRIYTTSSMLLSLNRVSVSNNGNFGLLVHGDRFLNLTVEVDNFEAKDNVFHGAEIQGVNSITIRDTLCSNNGGHGMAIDAFSSIVLKQFDSLHNTQAGLNIARTEDLFITDSILSSNRNGGLNVPHIILGDDRSADADIVNLSIHRSVISHNNHNALSTSSKHFEMLNSTIEENISINGGVVNVYSTTLNIQGCFFHKNKGFKGILEPLNYEKVEIRECSFIQNECTADDATITATISLPIVFEQCFVKENVLNNPSIKYEVLVKSDVHKVGDFSNWLGDSTMNNRYHEDIFTFTVHEKLNDCPNDCNGDKGTCFDTCICREGYTGYDCSPVLSCNDRGTYNYLSNVCDCDKPFGGVSCNTCAVGFCGEPPKCSPGPVCVNGICNAINESSCPNNWKDDFCEECSSHSIVTLIYPPSGSNPIVYVDGKNFPSDKRIKCHFGDETTLARDEKTTNRVTCDTSNFISTGRQIFTISWDGGDPLESHSYFVRTESCNGNDCKNNGVCLFGMCYNENPDSNYNDFNEPGFSGNDFFVSIMENSLFVDFNCTLDNEFILIEGSLSKLHLARDLDFQSDNLRDQSIEIVTTHGDMHRWHSTVYTNDLGRFEYRLYFNNMAGRYSVYAQLYTLQRTKGLTYYVDGVTFDSTSPTSVNLVPGGGSVKVFSKLRNIGYNSISQLTSLVEADTDSFDVTVELPSSKLEKDSFHDVHIKIIALENAKITKTIIKIRVRSRDGVQAWLDIPVSVLPVTACLICSPSVIQGMLISDETFFVDVHISHTESERVEIETEDRTINSKQISENKELFVFAFQLPAAQYSSTSLIGNIKIRRFNSISESTFRLPYNLTVVKSSVMTTLTVVVEDELTFNDPQKPRVHGAVVTLTDPVNTVSRQSDVNGKVIFSGLRPRSLFSISVSSENHAAYTSVVSVTAFSKQQRNIFLHREPMHLIWSSEVEQYDFGEKDIFMPIITVSPTIIEIDKDPEVERRITVVNHGVVAAYNFSIQLPSIEGWDLQIRNDYESVSFLPPKTQIIISVTITPMFEISAEIDTDHERARFMKLSMPISARSITTPDFGVLSNSDNMSCPILLYKYFMRFDTLRWVHGGVALTSADFRCSLRGPSTDTICKETDYSEYSREDDHYIIPYSLNQTVAPEPATCHDDFYTCSLKIMEQKNYLSLFDDLSDCSVYLGVNEENTAVTMTSTALFCASIATFRSKVNEKVIKKISCYENIKKNCVWSNDHNMAYFPSHVSRARFSFIRYLEAVENISSLMHVLFADIIEFQYKFLTGAVFGCAVEPEYGCDPMNPKQQEDAFISFLKVYMADYSRGDLKDLEEYNGDIIGIKSEFNEIKKLLERLVAVFDSFYYNTGNAYVDVFSQLKKIDQLAQDMKFTSMLFRKTVLETSDVFREMYSSCVSVRINLSKRQVLTLVPFEVIIELKNNCGVMLSNIDVKLFGVKKNDVFAIIDKPSVERQFDLHPHSSRVLRWTVHALRGAAPTLKSKWHNISAKVDYVFNDRPLIFNSNPESIMVQPSPKFNVKFFGERYAEGDNPFTFDSIERSIPFNLFALVDMEVVGIEQQLEMRSLRPHLVQIGSDLSSPFSIESITVNSKDVPPTLDVDLGTVAQKTIVKWSLLSRSASVFLNVSAPIISYDPCGDAALAMMNSVSFHQFIRIVQHQGHDVFLMNDGTIHNIVDDMSEPINMIDLIHVYAQTQKNSDVSYTVTLSIDPEETRESSKYFRSLNPMHHGWVIVSVSRRNGDILPMKNVWTSRHIRDRSVPFDDDMPPFYFEDYIHIFDEHTESEYTVLFKTPEDSNHPKEAIYVNNQGTHCEANNTVPLETTAIAKRVDIECPDGQIGPLAYWCSSVSSTWERYGDCKSIISALDELEALIDSDKGSATVVVGKLVQIVNEESYGKRTNEQSGSEEVEKTARIIKSLAEAQVDFETLVVLWNVTYKMCDAAVELRDNDNVFMHDDSLSVTEAANEAIYTLEHLSSFSTTRLSVNETWDVVSSSELSPISQMRMVEVDKESTLSPGKCKVTLPANIISGHKHAGAYSVCHPDKMTDTLDAKLPPGLENMKPNTPIFSCGIHTDHPENITNLKEPLIVELPVIRDFNFKFEPMCIYLDWGEWKVDGQVLNVTNTTVVCSFSHMTSFAVLMRVDVDGVHGDVLSYLTYIGCTLSLVGCLLTLLVFGLFPQRRVNIVIHLLIAIALVNLVFMVGINLTKNMYVCRGIAVLMNYLLLVMFFWMAVQALNLWLMITRLNRHTSTYYWRYIAFAWGLPVVIISIAMGVTRLSMYGPTEEYNLCWVNTSKGLAGTVLAPLTIVLIFNIYSFCSIVHVLIVNSKNTTRFRDSEEKKRKKLRAQKKQSRVFASMFVLMGATWVFGFLAMAGGIASIVFAYIFVFVNSLQGFFIFLSFCLKSDMLRLYAKRWPHLFGFLSFEKLDTSSRTPSSGATTNSYEMSKTDSSVNIVKRKNSKTDDDIRSSSSSLFKNDADENEVTKWHSESMILERSYEHELTMLPALAPKDDTIYDNVEGQTKVSSEPIYKE